MPTRSLTTGATARFDIVVGNPPFLSQMAAATTRGGVSRHGGGPYADAAAEFLALAVAWPHPDGGRIGLVLPQSILGARDAGARARASRRRSRRPRVVVVGAAPAALRRIASTCARSDCLRRRRGHASATRWIHAVVTDRLGIPHVDRRSLDAAGTLGDRAELNANFRDEYYALVPAVSDAADGPPLVTSGLIDPGRCRWGERPVTFAKQHVRAPRGSTSTLLAGRFPRWAAASSCRRCSWPTRPG